MKARWRGYITLGRLGIPVRLYSGVQLMLPKFVQLHEKDGSPVERVLRCRDEGREIAYSEIIRAIEHSDGRYVALSETELDRVASRSVKQIEIRQFCADNAVRPLYYTKPFYIVAASGGEYAYNLLREALVQTNKIAVGKFVIHSKEHLAAIGVEEDLLMLYQLRYTDEIVSRSKVPAPALPKARPDEVDLLRVVIERHSGPLFMRDYHDEYGERLRLLIQYKIKGLSPPRQQKPDARGTSEADIATTLQDILRESGVSRLQ